MVRPIHDAESFTFELVHLAERIGIMTQKLKARRDFSLGLLSAFAMPCCAFDQDNKVLTGGAPGLSHTALRHKIRKHGLQINRPLRIMTGNLQSRRNISVVRPGARHPRHSRPGFPVRPRP